MKKNRLIEVDGKKIRRQYFNIFMFFEIALALFMTIPALVFNTLWGNSGTKLNSWSEIFTHVIAVFIGLMLPVILISFLNRFLFGKVICVLNETGIYYLKGNAKRVIKWENVNCMEYGIRLWPFFTQIDHPFCYVHIIGEGSDEYINHAPFMLLKQVKKYNNRIKWKFEKQDSSWQCSRL